MAKALPTLALAFGLLATPFVAQAQQLAAGTLIPVRLRQLVSSFGSEPDTRISVQVIAPIDVDGRVVVPLGAELLGHVDAVRRVGLGLSHETAFVDLSFDTLRFPDGQSLSLSARVAEVDDAREVVDENGRIRGIRAQASFSSTLSGLAVSAGATDPMLLGLTVTSSLSVFRIPECEIILPAGAELHLRLVEAISLTRTFGPPVPPAVSTAKEDAALVALVRGLPFRTTTAGSNIPSDLTNLVFLGSRDAVSRAFDAAGWSVTDALSARSSYAALRAIVENQGFREAPMSILLLNGEAPAFTYAKTLDTFFKRHHVRVFARPELFENLPVWTASSTHDTGIGFATNTKMFIHIIDQNIDQERSKVMFDLLLTDCVDGVSLIDRPWVPRDASNATGDKLLTDGRIAVIRLNDCSRPLRADASVSPDARVRPVPSGSERFVRDVTLWFKNDAFRGNIVYQGYSGARMGLSALFFKKKPVADRTIHLGGEEFKVVPGGDAHKHELAPNGTAERPSFYPVAEPRRTFASQLEFSFSGGASDFGNSAFSTQALNAVVDPGGGPPVAVPFNAITDLAADWGFSLRTTLNPTRYISHEVGYTYSHTTLGIDLASPLIENLQINAATRISQFNYNLLLNVTPNGRRVRPYAAIGPGLQIVRLSEPPKHRDRLLHFAYRGAGWFSSLWNFGSRPPLEGGSILQLAVQYGGGIKFYLSPHIYVRSDFRETVSAQPDFWTKSYPSLTTGLDLGFVVEPGTLELAGPLRHHLFTVGVGVAF